MYEFVEVMWICNLVWVFVTAMKFVVCAKSLSYAFCFVI